MELRNLNHELSSVSAAFTGEDKINRILNKLGDLIDECEKQGKSKSETIELAINAYADNTEEAIGIALGSYNYMAKHERRRPDFEGFSKIFSAMSGIKDDRVDLHDIVGDDKTEVEVISLMPDEALQQFIKEEGSKCDTCDKFDNCEILKEGRKRGFI